MRIVCISDTHMRHKVLDPLPEGDVLIHAGDALSYGTEKEFWPFSIWMAHQRYGLKIYVPGNHDFFVQKNPDLARNLMKEGGCHLLIDRAVRYKEVKFCGSPWVPNLESWAFYGDRMLLTKKFEAIPDNIDVLITHCPPAGQQDLVSHSHVGSKELALKLAKLPQLKLHVFGHIHEGYGRIANSVNAAICTRDYEPSNKPIVVDLEL